MLKAAVQTGKALGYFGVYFMGQIIGGIAAGMLTLVQIMMERGDSEDAMSGYNELVSHNLGYGLILASVLTLLAYWLIFLVRKKKITEETDLKKISAKDLIITIIGGVGTICFLDFVIDFLPIPESLVEELVRGNDSLSNFPLWVSITATAVLIPILEEVVFRGLIFNRLSKALPTAAVVIITSVLFGLMHGSLLWCIWAGLVGLSICVIRVRTGSIIPGIIIHIMINSFAVICDNTGFTEDISLSADIAVTIAGAVLLVIYVLMSLCCRKDNDKAEVEVTTVDA